MRERSVCPRILGFVLTVVLAGCITATMVRFSPGFSADEELLDARLNRDSQEAIRTSHDAERGIGAGNTRAARAAGDRHRLFPGRFFRRGLKLMKYAAFAA
jgi:hypothetical protein